MVQVGRYFVLFQAEDGIRDAQEARGLGDVYKRQACSKWPRQQAPDAAQAELPALQPGHQRLQGEGEEPGQRHHQDQAAERAHERGQFLDQVDRNRQGQHDNERTG